MLSPQDKEELLKLRAEQSVKEQQPTLMRLNPEGAIMTPEEIEIAVREGTEFGKKVTKAEEKMLDRVKQKERENLG